MDPAAMSSSTSMGAAYQQEFFSSFLSRVALGMQQEYSLVP